MIAKEKTLLKRIKNDDKLFSSIMRKVTLKSDLTQEEYSYLLELCYLFSEEYNKTEKIGYFEFAYYLILKYSFQTQDLEPLLEFSLNHGFYPIAKQILTTKNKSILEFLLEIGLNNFKSHNLIQLKEQKEMTRQLIESRTNYRAFIAPTSYGKSSFIIDDLEKKNCNKIGIIVPKKALIWQTYRNIKEIARDLNYRILLHDTEYGQEERFIGIFTQERALRLIQDHGVCFDLLYIDEAHNLFEKDERTLLLSRLINLNKKLNANQKLVYLSPLINEANNLKFNGQEIIEMQKIQFNIKEFDVNFFSIDNKCKAYNRFVDEFYVTDHSYGDWLEFLFGTAKTKNLIYLYRPKDIEKLVQKFIDILDDIQDNELDEISDILCQYVHKDYLMSSLVKKGIIYIHSKVPDLVKDYLIEKFKTCKKIKFLISNTSVLEGVNFPIESIYILDVYDLSGNNLKNLCGRVNRLNEIFSSSSNLQKLMCPINFVQTQEFGRKNSFENKIKLLRSDIEDDVLNPLLIRSKMEQAQKEKIVTVEECYINQFDSKDIKTILIKNNINNCYRDFDGAVEKIYEQVRAAKKIYTKSQIIELISSIFISKFDEMEVIDYEIFRLKNEQTKRFYIKYLEGIFYADIKSKINFFLNYFKYYEEHHMGFYIGASFGEVCFSSEYYSGTRCVYVNPDNKTYKEKVNLAVIKSGLEDNFISYKLTKFVKALLDLDLISDEVFHSFMYNSVDKKTIELINAGFSYQLISFIMKNNLKDEITISKIGLSVTDKFIEILQQQDDFIRFEIGKML